LIFFHETEVWSKELLKVLFFAKQMNKFETSKKKNFWIFSKAFTAEKFLWILTLEKFSIFYQSLRDYNCGFNRYITPCRVSKHISWARKNCWEIVFVADCISGHFMIIRIFLIFYIFFHQFQQMLIVGLLRYGWMIWGPNMVILNVLVQFNFYLNYFEQSEANISTKRLWPHKNKMHPNCKDSVHPLIFLHCRIYSLFGDKKRDLAKFFCLNFVSKKWLSFAVKKQNRGKYFCTKIILQKLFFRKKYFVWICCLQKVIDFCRKKIRKKTIIFEKTIWNKKLFWEFFHKKVFLVCLVIVHLQGWKNMYRYQGIVHYIDFPIF